MSQCRYGFLLATPTSHAVIEGRQIMVFGMGDGPRDFKQDTSQVRIAFRRLAAEPLAPTLLVSGTQSSPRGQMFVGRKARHIRTDLGNDTGSCDLILRYEAAHMR